MILRPPGSTRTDTLFPYTSSSDLFLLRGLTLVLHRLGGGLERGLVLRRLFRFFVIFRDQDVDFGLQRLAARLLLIDLRLIGGLDLLRRGLEGVRARGGDRSEERRVGKECVSTCRSRWSQSP